MRVRNFRNVFSKFICSELLSLELLLFERRSETYHSKPFEKYIGIPRGLHAKLTKTITEPKVNLRKQTGYILTRFCYIEWLTNAGHGVKRWNDRVYYVIIKEWHLIGTLDVNAASRDLLFHFLYYILCFSGDLMNLHCILPGHCSVLLNICFSLFLLVSANFY